MINEVLKNKIAALPDLPGSYQMKDNSGNIIYIGKAKNLKNRVKQYFTGSHDYKTTKMVSLIADFDYIVTKSEKEALVLEINLIKKYQPRFNIMFMDDKTYPYIKLTNDEYPVLKIVRERKKDSKSTYFGPYPDVSKAKDTIALLNQIYPLRKCQNIPKKVCLYYHLNQCLGMCEYQVSKIDYSKYTKKVIKFLKGDTKDLINDLIEKRETYSDNLEYEKALEIQNLINSINQTVLKQDIESNKNDYCDVWNYYEDKGFISFSIIIIREGKIIKKVSDLKPIYEDITDVFPVYLSQYYLKHELPKEIIINKIEQDVLSDEINEVIFIPTRGHKKQLLNMAYQNAKEYHERMFTIKSKNTHNIQSALSELNKITNRNIHRIELFDNSHISGSNAVCGMVCFIEGKPSKNNYRKFKVENKADDIANMKEAIYRRYFRVLKDKLVKPDMIIVDGGINQIKAAKEIIDSLYLDILVYGLVKDNTHSTANLMNSELEIVPIKKDSELFYLLENMQDEVHRFAISFHRQIRSKSQTKSELESIKGIGEKRRKMLIKHFGSFENIKKASLDELNEVLPIEVAKLVFIELHE